MAEWAATFRMKFIDEEPFSLVFIDEEPFSFVFDEVIEVEKGYDPYLGPYRVIPKAYKEQILATKNKDMTDNVTVEEVPYTEVSNTKGTTVIIATE